jgi:hypothetical protein
MKGRHELISLRLPPEQGLLVIVMRLAVRPAHFLKLSKNKAAMFWRL